MDKVIVTSKKNQITIPSWARKYLGIHAHEQVKITAGQTGNEKSLNITAVPQQTSADKIWDQIDKNTEKYGSDDTPEMNTSPDMKSDE